MLVPRELAELLGELNKEEGIPYVLVGGIAVNLLGVERVTTDADVIVPESAEIGRAIRGFLERLGATNPRGRPLAEELFDGAHHIRARTPMGLIDFIPEGERPLDFASMSEATTHDELYGVEVPRAGLAHLVALKRLAGRGIDRQDLERLEAAYGALPELPDER